MSVDIKSLTDEGQKVYHLFNQVLDEKIGPLRTEVSDLKTNPKLDGESKQTIERIQAALNETQAEIKKLQIAASAPRVEEKRVDSEVEKRNIAFKKMLRYGTVNALEPEERKYITLNAEAGLETKTMYAADLTTGGFLATPEFNNELLKNIVLVSPMPSIVTMRSTAKQYVMTPKRTQTATAVRVAEQATRTETQNPKFGLLQNFAYESYAFALISRTDLEDSEMDLQQFIMDEFSEQFAKLIGNEYINGTGAAQSQSFGFLNDTAITNNGAGSVVTAAQGVIDYPALVKTKSALKVGYLPNATWVWTNETLGVLQSMTDNQNRPLWVPMGASTPDTFMGKPYVLMPDMPQVANGSLSIAFGDFKKGYQGVVRKQVSMQVLNERYADQNAVGFFGYYRFGGTTAITEAIKTLRVHS